MIQGMRWATVLVAVLGALAMPAVAAEYAEERPVKGLLFGSPDTFVELHGFINAEFFYFQKDAEHLPSFDVHNFYLSAKAQIAPSISLFGEIEHEHGATVKVDRAFVDWELAAPLTLRMGRFYVPFSFERVYYWAPVRLMTSRPYTVDIPFHEWSDSGVEAFGRLGMVGYDFSVVNGPFALTENGIPITDVRDTNRNKAVVGRINLFPVTGFQLGGAYASGKYDATDKLGYRLYELDARLHYDRLDLWAEYDRRTGDDEPCDSSVVGCAPLFTGDPASKSGYYVLAAYDVVRAAPGIHYLRPIARYDTISNVESHSGKRRVTLGLNWSPKPHLVFKSEYQWSNDFGAPEAKDNGVMLAVVADF